MAAGGYAVPQDPGALIDEALKKKFKEACVELVRIAPPESFGMYYDPTGANALKEYVGNLLSLLDQKPYLLAELVKEKQQTVRVTYQQLDKTWVGWALAEAAKSLRFTSRKKVDYSAFSSRIVPDGNKAWVEFRTVDCVFAAILAALGFRPAKSRVDISKLQGAQQRKEATVEDAEQAEQQAEDWLAGQLNFARRVTPDVALIYVLEQQFQWTRVADGAKVSEFKKDKTTPSSFILSYQQNGDQWHTVFLDHPSNSDWTVIDRQATAKATGPAKVNENGQCDAWKVDKTKPEFQKLQNAWDSRQG
jgi:hypothetical protein